MLDLGFAEELDALFSALPKSARPSLLFPRPPSRSGAPARPVVGRGQPAQCGGENGQAVAGAGGRSARASCSCICWRSGAGVRCAGVRQDAQASISWWTSCRRSIASDAIHGDKPQAASARAGALRGRGAGAGGDRRGGADIHDLPQVVNFDLPTVAEDYVHRIGRTGASGEAISLVAADVDQLAAIETLINQVLPRHDEPGSPDHGAGRAADHQETEETQEAKPPARQDPSRQLVRGERKAQRPADSQPSLGGGKPAKKRWSPRRVGTAQPFLLARHRLASADTTSSNAIAWLKRRRCVAERSSRAAPAPSRPRPPGRRDQEEQRVDGVAPGIGVGAAEHADHRQRHHPYLRVDHLQPGGAQGAESTAGGVGFDRFGRAAGDLPGQVEQPADPSQAIACCNGGWRSSHSPAPRPTSSTISAAAAGAKDDGKRRQQAEARAVAQHQDVGRAGVMEATKANKRKAATGSSWRPRFVGAVRAGLGDMAIGSVGLRMAE